MQCLGSPSRTHEDANTPGLLTQQYRVHVREQELHKVIYLLVHLVNARENTSYVYACIYVLFVYFNVPELVQLCIYMLTICDCG